MIKEAVFLHTALPVRRVCTLIHISTVLISINPERQGREQPRAKAPGPADGLDLGKSSVSRRKIVLLADFPNILTARCRILRSCLKPLAQQWPHPDKALAT